MTVKNDSDRKEPQCKSPALVACTERYRLQCDRLEAMWIPLKELVSRLKQHFNRGKYGDFKVSFDGSLPLQEYYELVDAHFEVRLHLLFQFSFCSVCCHPP